MTFHIKLERSSIIPDILDPDPTLMNRAFWRQNTTLMNRAFWRQNTTLMNRAFWRQNTRIHFTRSWRTGSDYFSLYISSCFRLNKLLTNLTSLRQHHLQYTNIQMARQSCYNTAY